MRIHLAAEHAFEFELAHALFEPWQLAIEFLDRGFVVFRFGQLQQLTRIADAVQRRIEFADLPRELRALAAQGLRLVGLAPDRGLLELARNFL
jgi:hypothetical protein